MLSAVRATLAAVCLLAGAARQPTALRADHMLIEKSRHRLTLLRQGAAVKTYHAPSGKR